MNNCFLQQSFSGQGIAVGNLGLLAMRQEDYSTARACMEQYVHLVHTLKDVAAEINAWMLVCRNMTMFCLCF